MEQEEKLLVQKIERKTLFPIENTFKKIERKKT